MDVSIGSIYHFYSNLAGKPKFHIVVSLEPKKLAFFINTSPTKFALANSDLIACNPQILQVEHPFLKYDSVVDCCEAVSLANHANDLIDVNRVGNLGDKAKHTLLAGVEASKTINRGDKRIIMEALSSLITFGQN